jgi:ubiquinone/menaquinone biosynthesis C-methylase UbiE
MADRSADELKRLSRERFGARADGYRESASHAGGPDLKLLLTWLDPKPAERTLDVATGGGHVALALARTGADVDACDLTPEMLGAAEALLAENDCTAAFAVAEAEELPYDDATFDIVTCRIAAHHFPDVSAFFAEVARVLKPGGRFGFQDQTLPPEGPSAVLTDLFERTRDRSHNQAFNQLGWVTLIERVGLVVEHTELIDKRHDFAEWTARQDCDADAVAELEQLMAETPEGMHRWLEPVYDGTRLVAFRNRHLVVLARKPM